MIVDNLKDTLNGGYKGLYGEVVTDDCYRLQSITWEPTIIFDLGANVGVFSRYSRSLFPKAKIIAVEPDEENCIHYRKFTSDTNTILIESAIGTGNVWHYLKSANGAMQVYVSEGLGYPADDLSSMLPDEITRSYVDTIMPAELIKAYWRPNQKAIMKIDIEGAENCIFDDPASIAAIKQMDYIAMELHFYAVNGKELAEVKHKTTAFIEALEDTHLCELKHVNFYAIKK